MKPDQDWIVLEPNSASKNAPVASTRELIKDHNHREDHESLLNVEDSHHAVREQADDNLDLLSSIDTQRTELAAMMNTILKSQAHEQEERELSQAQSYAFQIQQEEREARELETKEADLEHLEAKFAKALAENNEKMQCLRIDLDAARAASKDGCDLLVTLQKQADELKRDWESRMSSLVDGLAQLQGQVGELAAQVSQFSAAVAQSKMGHGSPAQADAEVGHSFPSRSITLQESRGDGSAHVQGYHPYDSTNGGVRLPTAYTDTAQRHSSKRSQYDCEWYLPEP